MYPDWNDLPAFARHEAERDAPAAGMVPRLLLWRDGEPIIYVRGRRPTGNEGGQDPVDRVLQEMASPAGFVMADRAAVIAACRLTSSPVAGTSEVPAAINLNASTGVLVERRWRTAGDGTEGGDAVLLLHGRDDQGHLVWADVVAAGGQRFAPLLDRCIGDAAAPISSDEMPLTGLVYALSKFGHVVAVADAWHDRLGLDEPVAPAMVRPADVARARRLRARHRRRTQTPNGARTASPMAGGSRGPAAAGAHHDG